MRGFKNILALTAAMLLVFALDGCGEKSKTKEEQRTIIKTEVTPEQIAAAPEIKISPKLTARSDKSAKWVKILSYHIIMPEAEIKRNSLVRFSKASDMALPPVLARFVVPVASAVGRGEPTDAVEASCTR